MAPQTLLFCKISYAKRLFSPFKPFILEPQFNQQFNFLFHTFLGPPFSQFLYFLFFKWQMLDHLQNPVGANIVSKIVPWRQQDSIFIFTVVPRCAPLFSRSHRNYCAVGTWCFLKVLFSMAIGSFLFFRRFFVICYIQCFNLFS